MKTLLITILSFISVSLTWSGNFNEAQQQAKKSHHQILINFSGSDWCGPCIRLRHEILESESFENYAKGHLELVRADFPRQKKNQLPAVQIKQNEMLAEKYNPNGKFPFTLLVDENGKVLQVWDGFPTGITPEKFVAELTTFQLDK